jgi:hypothetical protein
MFRFLAVALFVSLFSFPATLADAATQPTARNQGGDVQVQTIGYRYRMNRSSTGRRPGTGFTPWYMLPKTDPRRFNGPHYYWNK